MDRIKNFQDTVEHRQPKDIVMDLGGCPLSSVEGQTQARLLRYLGYDAPDDAPLHVELGCGKGTFVCESARRNPDICYIAFEDRKSVV